MLFVYILVVSFIVVITFFYLSSLVNNIVYNVPQVSTFNSDLNILKSVFDKYELEGKSIADLGSGRGKMLRLFEKEYKMNSTGFEIDLSNVLLSRITSKFLKLKNKSFRKNYFKADLKNFDYIYTYLFPCLMEKVEKKIWSDCKKGTIIFVNAFKFEKHEPIEVFQKNGKDKIFVYEI